MEKFEFLNETQADKNIGLTIKFSGDHWLSEAGDMFLLKLYGDSIGTIPAFVTKKRARPVRLAELKSTDLTVTARLPPSLKVESLPAGFELKNPYMQSSIEYSVKENVITADLRLEFISRDIPVEAVSRVYIDWDTISQAHRRSIVLKKK